MNKIWLIESSTLIWDVLAEKSVPPKNAKNWTAVLRSDWQRTNFNTLHLSSLCKHDVAACRSLCFTFLPLFFSCSPVFKHYLVTRKDGGGFIIDVDNPVSIKKIWFILTYNKWDTVRENRLLLTGGVFIVQVRGEMKSRLILARDLLEKQRVNTGKHSDGHKKRSHDVSSVVRCHPQSYFFCICVHWVCWIYFLLHLQF